ncbi:MAG TPA: redoxin domain-containing protein [Steroidobacteraceae bacterium]|nr:redoxin domain-containing protein [Steroidobacteraceae bacterium]
MSETKPRLDEPAPDFEGRSTHGIVRLRDFAGAWLVFFTHPADFTPACASEPVGFSRHADRFAALNCRLLGLSADGVYAHLAWRENIREHLGVSIDFPILEDASLEISRRYGMVTREGTAQRPDGRALSGARAAFIIDPAGILRSMLYYPPTTGRSVSEILRLPGDQTLQPAAQTVATVEGRREMPTAASIGIHTSSPRRRAERSSRPGGGELLEQSEQLVGIDRLARNACLPVEGCALDGRGGIAADQDGSYRPDCRVILDQQYLAQRVRRRRRRGGSRFARRDLPRGPGCHRQRH